MTVLRVSWHRSAGALALAAVVGALIAGCNGPTTVEKSEATGGYSLNFSMDPATLNPPQLTTISYSIKGPDGKPVTQFQPVAGALIHNVLVSRDMQYFKHTYANKIVADQLSVLTNFAQTGKFYSYTIFQPAGGEQQVNLATVQSGDAGKAPDLVVDTEGDRYRSKVAGGVRFDLAFGPSPVKAGQATQLALYVTEKGHPVNALWPFLGAPGYMWALDQEGKHFAYEAGAGPSQMFMPQSTGTPVAGATPAGTAVAEAPEPQGTPAGGAPPTLVPQVAQALATRTAQPAATLIPVQQTAMASLLGTPAVVPSTGYGPYVVFTHTFPEPGLYKVWFETQYHNQVLVVDWVLRVE